MECSAKVFAKGDPEKLYECLAPEDTKFDRSSFTVKKTEEGVEFDVKAKDAVALRATLNSISQLLIIFEGASKPKQNV
jgi:tRNA threonylcarbamoyladenosine modification (KEOPS) complex  Pcc1 subunit